MSLTAKKKQPDSAVKHTKKLLVSDDKLLASKHCFAKIKLELIYWTH